MPFVHSYLLILQQQSCCIMAEICTCSTKSKCKTKRCKCLTLRTHCGSACSCGPECTNRSDLRDHGLRDSERYSLRESVSGLTDTIWSYRDDVDAYTKRSKAESEGDSMENDHVLEIQILEESLPPAYNTRAVTDTLKVIANHVSNLNVTTHEINQSKKGPFTIWRNRYSEKTPISLDEAIDLTSSPYLKTMKGERYWDNIKKEVVITYDQMIGHLDDPAQVIGDDYRPSANMSKVLVAYKKELESLLEAMKI